MGRSPCCEKEGLKKGPWTPEEDDKLIAYVMEHGHGNWRALPNKCGLLRCGKSCRLRWTNYLRPDIKRGLFSQSEEQKIILLHALVGNKWAFIASQLPKRTDNEIKNFWNTVLRKRMSKQSLMISTSTASPLNAPAAAGQTMKQGNKVGGGSSSSSSSSTNCGSMQGRIQSRSHLAQWESARLEAEARLAKESQSSKTLKILSFNLGSFSPPPPNTTTPLSTTAAAAATTPPTTTTGAPFTTTTTTATGAPFSTTTTTPFTNSFCKAQYPTQHYPCSIAHLLSQAASNTCMINPSPSSNNPSSLLPSASMSSLSSQGSTSSALTLRPNGRLSWKTQELAFSSTRPSWTQKVSNTIKLDMGHQQSAHKIAGYGSAGREDMELLQQQKEAGGPGDHQLRNMQEIMVDLNSMMSLSSADNWQDLLFDVENSCSDVVSTAWGSPISTSRIDNAVDTDATSLLVSNNEHQPALDHACMDLNGLALSHMDSLLCDHSTNQHISNVLKEILYWDTPATPSRLSISS